MANPLVPASRPDTVAERYLRDVDRTLLRRNLKLSHEERLEQLQELARFAEELQRAGRKATEPRSPCLDLPTLIKAKIAAGRPKDLQAIAELRALLDEKPRTSSR